MPESHSDPPTWISTLRCRRASRRVGCCPSALAPGRRRHQRGAAAAAAVADCHPPVARSLSRPLEAATRAATVKAPVDCRPPGVSA